MPAIAEAAKSQDKYFLDNFILSYIESIITRTLYSASSVDVKTWKDYIIYLKDFVGVSKVKGDEFIDISKYSSYFEFRAKSEDFVQFIKKSE